MDTFSHECVKEGSCMESFALYETVTFCVVPYNIFRMIGSNVSLHLIC